MAGPTIVELDQRIAAIRQNVNDPEHDPEKWVTGFRKRSCKSRPSVVR
jgi:hypothetical protein